MNHARTVLALLIIGSTALPSVGCLALVETVRVEDKIERGLPDIQGKSLIVETFNGSVKVERSLDQSFKAVITQRAGGTSEDQARKKLEAIEVLLVLEGDSVRLKVERPKGSEYGNLGASLDLLVPQGAPLNITTSNGSVDADKVSAPLRISTSNANIKVVASESARLAKFDLNTSNGEVVIISSVPIQTSAETSNASIHYEAPLGPEPTTLSTSNANVDVILPQDSAFSWKLSTSNGSVVNEFSEGKLTGKSTKSTGSVGKDAASNLTVSTSNGSIKLIKPQ